MSEVDIEKDGDGINRPTPSRVPRSVTSDGEMVKVVCLSDSRIGQPSYLLGWLREGRTFLGAEGDVPGFGDWRMPTEPRLCPKVALESVLTGVV